MITVNFSAYMNSPGTNDDECMIKIMKLTLIAVTACSICRQQTPRNIPSSSVMVAEAESPPAENWADCPLLLWMLAVRENVSSCSKMRSLLIVIEQAGVEESPGILPAVKVVRHVTPMKSPPAVKAPSVVGEVQIRFTQRLSLF